MNQYSALLLVIYHVGRVHLAGLASYLETKVSWDANGKVTLDAGVRPNHQALATRC